MIESISMHWNSYVYIYVYIYIHMYTCIYMYVYINVYVDIYTYKLRVYYTRCCVVCICLTHICICCTHTCTYVRVSRTIYPYAYRLGASSFTHRCFTHICISYIQFMHKRITGSTPNGYIHTNTTHVAVPRVYVWGGYD